MFFCSFTHAWLRRGAVGVLPVVIAAGLIVPAGAITIAGYAGSSDARYDRFSSGFPGSPVPNTDSSFIGGGFDWSGVGWDSRPPGVNDRKPPRFVAMISDQHFVYSQHWPLEGQLNFYSPTLDSVVSYSRGASIVGFEDPVGSGGSDFAVGTLTSPLNPAHGIITYPIFIQSTFEEYYQWAMLVHGTGGAENTAGAALASPRIGMDRIEDGIVADVFGFNPSPPSPEFYPLMPYRPALGGDTLFEGGDSGSPTFANVNGQLALAGVNSAVFDDDEGNFYNGITFVPNFTSQLTSRGIPFATLTPEPGRVVLLVVGLVAACWRVGRCRRC